LRGQLALEKDHLTRMVYLELLQKLHENGGRLHRDQVAGAVFVTEDEADHAIDRLVKSGRISEDAGILTNRRVLKDLAMAEGFPRNAKESGRRGGKASSRVCQGSLQAPSSDPQASRGRKPEPQPEPIPEPLKATSPPHTPCSRGVRPR